MSWESTFFYSTHKWIGSPSESLDPFGYVFLQLILKKFFLTLLLCGKTFHLIEFVGHLKLPLSFLEFLGKPFLWKQLLFFSSQKHSQDAVTNKAFLTSKLPKHASNFWLWLPSIWCKAHGLFKGVSFTDVLRDWVALLSRCLLFLISL